MRKARNHYRLALSTSGQAGASKHRHVLVFLDKECVAIFRQGNHTICPNSFLVLTDNQLSYGVFRESDGVFRESYMMNLKTCIFRW